MAYSTNNSSGSLDLRTQIKQLLEIELGNSKLADANNNKALSSISDIITTKILEIIKFQAVENKLAVYLKYEQEYLKILKDNKEEIKFACSIQEDIRKERAKFFSETLKEVSASLKSTGLDDATVSDYIKELVSSYTNSLDASANFAREQATGDLAQIQSEVENIKKEFV